MSVHPAFKAATWMEVIECYKCSILFAVPRDFDKRRLSDHDDFWCPRGHRQRYIGKTKEQKLQEQLEHKEVALEREREWKRHYQERSAHQERRASAFKGHLTRTKKRVGNGVCPCCNRTFKDLANHMNTQHPEYAGEGHE